ncbi:MAG: hypothetical protein GC165_05695 [Armatimonadetes bacterium]|nr:hypothetical protein [Armatimonadota bacterium]
MKQGWRWLSAILAIAACVTASAQTYETFDGKEQNAVQLFNHLYTNLRESKTPGNIIRSFAFSFRNRSKREIGEIDIRMVMRERGTKAVVYDCGVKTIKSFASSQIPYVGSLLPENQSALLESFDWEMPSSSWRTDTYESFEIAKVRAYKNPTDYHQMGHLYTLMRTATPDEVLSVLKKDPTLCKLKNDINLTSTHLAFATSGKAVIDFVLAHGGSLSDKTTRGGTILDYAPISTDTAALEIAVKQFGGDVNHQNALGMAPIEKAVNCDNRKAVRWLIDHHANLDIQDNSGTTPGMAAIGAGYPPCLKLLVDGGAKPNFINRKGWGWLHQAVLNPGMLDYVDAYKVPIDQSGPPTQMTPLLLAASMGKNDAVRWLVAHGANTKAKSADGKTASELASKSNTLGTDRFYLEAVQQGLADRKKKG